jgi:hypothetical protein
VEAGGSSLGAFGSGGGRIERGGRGGIWARELREGWHGGHLHVDVRGRRPGMGADAKVVNSVVWGFREGEEEEQQEQEEQQQEQVQVGSRRRSREGGGRRASTSVV